jgi:GntR family transcriptional regulator/MocR family aminotransferase
MTGANGPSAEALAIELDRSGGVSLVEQLRRSIHDAIRSGQLKPGARLPSWRDLAAQLGVARGTVREAYERLVEDGLITASGSAGTHVASRPPRAHQASALTIAPPRNELLGAFSSAPLPFQMGVSAQDAFPAKLWSRIHARAARDHAFAPTTYADPRGEPVLREQIAAYLAIARGLQCAPEQIIVTGGFRSGLHLALRALRAEGREAWMEEPGFFLTRTALELAGLRPIPIDVDDDGLDVAQGIAMAPTAALAIVTPAQQAPLGVALSPSRRAMLLSWAQENDAWILEDDYLSELQLHGRAVPALASSARAARVIHLGSFSKTLSPALGVGFIVAPDSLAPRFGHIANCLAPAPNRSVQTAIAEFMREGHFVRHLRRMKRVYASRRDALRSELKAGEAAGLAILLRLPDGTDDEAIVRDGRKRGISPVPLSMWYGRPSSRKAGLLLGVTNLTAERMGPACESLRTILEARG